MQQLPLLELPPLYRIKRAFSQRRFMWLGRGLPWAFVVHEVQVWPPQRDPDVIVERSRIMFYRRPWDVNQQISKEAG